MKQQILLDDGFQFGLGLFETICLKNQMPAFLDLHLERLQHSLHTLHIDQTISEDDVYDFLAECKQDNAIPDFHALKIMVTEKNKLFVLRDNPYTKERIERGFQLSISPILRNETSPLTYLKTMNYGDNILEKRRTRQLGIDEFLFLNSKGELTEGSTTNIFFVKEGSLLTPHLSCGLLPGTIRRFLLDSFHVQEVILHPEDITEMEECFVCNSLMGIMPVNRIDDHIFSSRQITQVCQKHLSGRM